MWTCATCGRIFEKANRTSAKNYKNCIDITTRAEIDEELMRWIGESYHLKDTS